MANFRDGARDLKDVCKPIDGPDSQVIPRLLHQTSRHQEGRRIAICLPFEVVADPIVPIEGIVDDTVSDHVAVKKIMRNFICEREALPDRRIV